MANAACSAVVVLLLTGTLPGLSLAGEIPAEGTRLQARLSAGIQPSVRSWIVQEANRLHASPVADEGRLRADILARFRGQRLGSDGVDAIAFLVLMQAAQDADREVKAGMARAGAKTAARSSPTRKAPAQSSLRGDAARAAPSGLPGESDEMSTLNLQKTMDRRSKYINLLSSIMKKFSSTQGALVSNLK